VIEELHVRSADAAAVAESDPDRAPTIAMTEILQVPEESVAGLRRTPMWAPMAALTPTWVRELRVIDTLGPDVTRYAPVTAETLFLFGGRIARHHVEATAALRAVLPATRLVEFPGHAHVAHVTGPKQVAEAIAGFATTG